MGTIFGRIVVVGLLVLAWMGSASAFEVCLSLSNFGNRFKFEVTPVGGNLAGPNFFQLTGSERVFADRAVSGTAFPGSSNDFRFGFLLVANNGPNVSDIIFNASLSRSTLSGPYTGHLVTADQDISGTMSVISCVGVLDSGGGLDAAAK